ncbi:MAG: shikimate dehydrogenase [Rhodospirillales bacterium]|nr:shikimate dehydrogenase [Rhodospirillales bacterium]MDE2575829.1 shikimate dehydrogenase [Rhodospirillales bacterium]
MAEAAANVLLGLIGGAIGLSRSPALYQGEAAAQGLTCIYRLIDLDRLGLGAANLPELLTAAERFGFAGLNITYPCKQAVIAHLHELSPDAAALGAVNTVVLRDGRRIGHNTDWHGYAEAFRRDMQGAALDRVVQFGTGGAGAAVAYALLKLGVRQLSLVDTDAARAEAAAAQMATHFGAGRVTVAEDAQAAVREADGIVNATPVGMAKFPGTPFPAGWLRPAAWVSEIIYFPLETELLREARALGCRTIDGSGMNVWQAAEAFRLFTGRVPDIARLRRIFDAAGR